MQCDLFQVTVCLESYHLIILAGLLSSHFTFRHICCCFLPSMKEQLLSALIEMYWMLCHIQYFLLQEIQLGTPL